ncbi:meiotic nuclear division protein-like protein 1 [Xylona heveae TC161]|uniref:Meiotic nuclear division protein 1 n=1 Tax=Xylona heveae (strain CBS 132557 / TC161) TaxID=1328760 RepID=A0A165IEW6_XYLHT|nr:meiotic nuclear division protein-like protein 1 [Xylona heveae TC161]KZF24795.1 meiotic nuclear division protein-like protein 1 [Xylona heveae TC161]
MAPKSLPPLAKQTLIHSWLQKSGTAHNIRDLEKMLPQVASINGMQVKDYLQALSDEGKICVEKIGSGNWYWSFPSEERRIHERTLTKLKSDRDKLLASTDDLQMQVTGAQEARRNEMTASDGSQGLDAVSIHGILQHEVENLRQELRNFRDCDPAEILMKQKEIDTVREGAQRWTNNIYILEGYYAELCPGDREGLDVLRRELYGESYDEEEGFEEL